MALAALLAACGGGGGTGKTGGGSLSVSDYLAQEREAQCRYLVSCCQPATGSTTYASVAACVSANPVSGEVTAVSQAIADGTVVYDAAVAATCLTAFESLVSACSSTISGAVVTSLLCRGALAGTLAMGASCDPANDLCATGSYCKLGADVCTPIGANGASCYAQTGSACESGFCDDSGTCAAQPDTTLTALCTSTSSGKK